MTYERVRYIVLCLLAGADVNSSREDLTLRAVGPGLWRLSNGRVREFSDDVFELAHSFAHAELRGQR